MLILRRIFSSLWLVFLLSMLILFLIMAGALVRSHEQELHGVEQNVVYSLQLLFDGQALYSNPESAPFNVVQYMPAYYAFVKNIGSLLQIQGSDVFEIYLLGRAISFSFAIGLAFLIAWQVAHFGLQKEAGIVSFLLALILPTPWFFLARPDAMMSFFVFGAMLLFLYTLQNQNHGVMVLILVGVALATGIFLKQTAVLFLGLILLFPFYSMKNRLWILLGTGIGTGLLSFILRDYFSLWPLEGNVFYMNVVDGLKNGINLLMGNQMVYNIYYNHYRPFLLLPLVVTVLSVAEVLRKREKGLSLTDYYRVFAAQDRVFSFLLFAFWFVTIASLVMAMKDGSAINYLIDSMLLALLLLAYFLSQKEIQSKWLNRFEVKLAIALCLTVLIFGLSTDIVLRHGEDIVALSPENDETWQETLAVLETEFATAPEDYFLYYPHAVFDRWVNLLYHEQALLNPREVYDLSNFDLSGLRDYLEDGRLRWFITYHEPFPDDVFGYTDLQDYFELWQETDTHLIYRNRNSE